MTKRPPKKNDPSYATVIFNPKSGSNNAEYGQKLLMQKLSASGWNGNFEIVTAKNTATSIARRCIQEGKKHLIACGGDGTVREVLEQVVGIDICLGIVPMGTGNILAKNIGIPLEIGEAVECALYGKVKKIDVGRANGIIFGMTASMGIGVEAMAGAKKNLKKRFGPLAYFAAAYKKISTRLDRYRIVLNNQRVITRRAKGIIAANVGTTIGGITLAPGANLHSGDMRVAVVKARWIKDWINLLFHALAGHIVRSDYYEILSAQSVEIIPLRGPKRFECDGSDFSATSKLKIELLPKAARIMSPSVDSSVRLVHKKENILIFDFDGTIADTLKLQLKIFNNLAPRFGYQQIGSSQVEHLRGKSAREILQQLNISALQLPSIYAAGRKEFLRHAADIAVFPDIKDVLKELSKHYGLGIVTSNDTDIVGQFLKKHDMEMFNFVYSDKSIFGKGAILKHLLNKYKFNKNNVLYIGDEVRDIDAAKEAGVKVISVTWGFNTKQALASHHPDHIVDDPREIIDKVKYIS